MAHSGLGLNWPLGEIILMTAAEHVSPVEGTMSQSADLLMIHSCSAERRWLRKQFQSFCHLHQHPGQLTLLINGKNSIVHYWYQLIWLIPSLESSYTLNLTDAILYGKPLHPIQAVVKLPFPSSGLIGNCHASISSNHPDSCSAA